MEQIVTMKIFFSAITYSKSFILYIERCFIEPKNFYVAFGFSSKNNINIIIPKNCAVISDEKYDYMQEFGVETNEGIAKTLAVFGAFTEGLQLFASFAILMNFQRFGKMKGMGQIVTWSVRDETLHTNSIIKLYFT
jgi:ribonucleotide reductase beta subunit family protein with ferritin-like domain